LFTLHIPGLLRTKIIMNIQKYQKGKSVIGHIMTLAVLGFGVYIGFQYIPQIMESGSVDSILGSIEANHKASPVRNVDEILTAIDRQLQVNEMYDMKENFYVTQNGSSYTIEVNYERILDLGFQKRTIQYEKTLTLK
jgi:hypothetical protein